MSGPVPGTPTPWLLDGPDWFGDYNIQWKHGVDTDSDHLAIAAVVSNLRPADDVAANAAAIVHRVNNWDALEAERDALKARVEALVEAVLAVVNATRAYLPPDGVDAQECLNRILGATDNPKINPIIWEAENGLN